MKKLITIITLTLLLAFSTCSVPGDMPSRRYVYATDTVFGPNGEVLYVTKTKKQRQRELSYPLYLTVLAVAVIAVVMIKHNK